MIGVRVAAVLLEEALIHTKIDEASTRLLRQTGFETLRDAQQSIQPGRGASAPGTPPHDRTGVLKRFIRYAVDAAAGILIVGPEYLPRKSRDAPAALEHGGVSISAQGDAVHIAQRAFMAPALARTLPRMLARLTDSIQ